MEKEKTAEVLEMVTSYYPHMFRDKNQEDVLESWHRVLQKYDFNLVMNNLERWVESEKFPPAISNLVERRNTPRKEETQAFFKKMDEWKKRAATPEEAEKHKKRIRKVLGMDQDG